MRSPGRHQQHLHGPQSGRARQAFQRDREIVDGVGETGRVRADIDHRRIDRLIRRDAGNRDRAGVAIVAGSQGRVVLHELIERRVVVTVREIAAGGVKCRDRMIAFGRERRGATGCTGVRRRADQRDRAASGNRRGSARNCILEIHRSGGLPSAGGRYRGSERHRAVQPRGERRVATGTHHRVGRIQ